MVSRTFKIIKMTEFNTKELSGMLQVALHINSSNLETMNWQENFMNYIETNNIMLYKEAVEYADKKEMSEEEEIEVTCCNVEITEEIKDNNLCPVCLEHI